MDISTLTNIGTSYTAKRHDTSEKKQDGAISGYSDAPSSSFGDTLASRIDSITPKNAAPKKIQSKFNWGGGPDMSRNMALAGQTVSVNGYNITYNEDGYAVSAIHYVHKAFRGTDKGIAAPSKESVLGYSSQPYYNAAPVQEAPAEPAVEDTANPPSVQQAFPETTYTAPAPETAPQPVQEASQETTYAAPPKAAAEPREDTPVYAAAERDAPAKGTVLNPATAGLGGIGKSLGGMYSQLLNWELFDEDDEEKKKHAG